MLERGTKIISLHDKQYCFPMRKMGLCLLNLIRIVSTNSLPELSDPTHDSTHGHELHRRQLDVATPLWSGTVLGPFHPAWPYDGNGLLNDDGIPITAIGFECKNRECFENVVLIPQSCSSNPHACTSVFSLDQGCEWITTGIQDGSPSPLWTSQV